MRWEELRTRPAVERLLCLGYSSPEIARRLNKNRVTIERAITAVYEHAGLMGKPEISKRVVFVLQYLGERGMVDLTKLKTLEMDEDPGEGEA